MVRSPLLIAADYSAEDVFRYRREARLELAAYYAIILPSGANAIGIMRRKPAYLKPRIDSQIAIRLRKPYRIKIALSAVNKREMRGAAADVFRIFRAPNA